MNQREARAIITGAALIGCLGVFAFSVLGMYIVGDAIDTIFPKPPTTEMREGGSRNG